MFKSYDEALNWIHGTQLFGMKPGLKRMEWMLEKLAHPERKFNAVHVAGTNGKGSTVTFLRNMLEAHGQTVGTFTSPYIERFNERFSVNGEPLSDSDILRLANRIYPLSIELENTELGGPSEFEIITAMMFLYFGEGHADVVIIEVGLGGLLDSTNVVTPVVSAITTIGFDHVNVLGNTLPEIALQKAGIIKPGIPVVTGNIAKEAMSAIKENAEEKRSPIYQYDKDFFVHNWQTLASWGEQFTFEDSYIHLKTLQLQMLGKYQIENAAVAIETLRVYSQEVGISVNYESIRKGLKQAFWPGRMERLSDEPLIVIDGAHNEHAVKRLAETIKNDFNQQEVHIILATLQDKDIQQMIHLLKELPNVRLTLTSFDYPRAARAEELEQYSMPGVEFIPDWQLALLDRLNEMDDTDILLLTGSLYFISDVRRYFKEADND